MSPPFVLSEVEELAPGAPLAACASTSLSTNGVGGLGIRYRVGDVRTSPPFVLSVVEGRAVGMTLVVCGTSAGLSWPA